MNFAKDKRCLVVTYGPVPTSEYQTIEGGGMRAWGLAQGLKSHGAKVTVAVNASFPQKQTSHQGVELSNWSPDEAFANFLNSFDAVIVSYCMGSDSVFIADHINDDVQLILDVYVPIYVEVSARESKNIEDEYLAYMGDVTRYNHVLKRGDYFLCASQTQKIYYTGVLSSLGIINPRSYREDRIIIAPFGIHDSPAKADRNPYTALGVKDSDFLVLWFGGLYPWFRVNEFLETVKELSSDKKIKFAIVGGKNPFNPNPDFSRQYEIAIKFAKEHGLYNKSLIFVDWVDYEDRVNWYARAQVVISINQPGDENIFSWRTRVMDYVWGGLPIITNGGDPLSEELLAAGAAIKLDGLSKESMAAAIKNVLKDHEVLSTVKARLDKIRKNYYWEIIMAPVAKIIGGGLKPSLEDTSFRKKVGAIDPSSNLAEAPPNNAPSLKRPVEFSKRALLYAKRKGFRRSADLAYRIGRAQLKRKTQPNRPRQYYFISHPIDNTGAPLVLLRMVEEFAEKFGAANVKLFAPGILPHQLKRLKQKGIFVDKAALALGDRLIDLQLGLNPDDFLLMNTLAVYSNYRGYILRALNSGRLKHAYWFIHEDTAQLPFVARDLTEANETSPISTIANKGKLTLVVPSKKVQQEYMKLWKIKNVAVLPLNVDVPEEYQRPRSADEYSKLNFLLSGTPADSRKGQLLAISVFYSFLKTYYEKKPADYRDFSLSLVGIGSDYVSQQIKVVGELLGKRLKIHPSIPYDQSLQISADCNAVICCSLNETFALYVAEGMFMGHVILRNDSAGMEEQLKDGVNGLYIDSRNINQFVSAIERLLNKKTTSNQALMEMGRASQSIIKPYAKNSYLKVLEL